MGAKKGASKDRESAEAQSPRGFDEMCREMMSGGMLPDCCGPEMREMMSRWMAGLQAKRAA